MLVEIIPCIYMINVPLVCPTYLLLKPTWVFIAVNYLKTDYQLYTPIQARTGLSTAAIAEVTCA